MSTSLQRRAATLVHQDVEVDELCLRLDEVLRQHIPYAAAAWSTHDPTTGLSTSCTITGVPEDPSREQTIFRHEFDPEEPSTYLDLIRDGRTVALLSEETDGDLSRAARWREVFAAFGVTDEMRAILWSHDLAWGSISLYRTGARFDPTEVDLVTGLAPIVADGIRLALLRAAATRPSAIEDPPGILAVRDDGCVLAVTAPAQRWLDLGGAGLVTAARAVAAVLQRQSDWPGATSRVPTAAGPVLALHAAHRLDAGGVAVIVEAARPSQVGAMLVDAYGLTERQRDVLRLLLLGRSMTQIAAHLGVSEHTVHDHRKAIYRRTGVSSRSELAALLQAEQYDPRNNEGLTPSPYGGYLAND